MTINEADREQLRAWVRSQSVPYPLVRRAWIGLLSGEGHHLLVPENARRTMAFANHRSAFAPQRRLEDRSGKAGTLVRGPVTVCNSWRAIRATLMTNAELLEKLDKWASGRKIWPKSFDCPHYKECQASLSENAKLEGGKTCLMSYVGKEYGAADSGVPFRLVIVGIDHGWRGEQPEDFGGCQTGMEDALYGDGKGTNFNPHYSGVIRTAAAILGYTGRHCLEVCYERNECVGDRRPPGERCLLRLLAQPNLVKCAPGRDMATKSTTMMLNRCSRHLVSELEVLRPDLLVFHGGSARWALPWALQTEKAGTLTPFPESPMDDDFPVIHELSGKGYKSLVLFLAHPSRRHLAKQWKSIVVPSLKLLRSRRYIPSP